jgi:hypothetical protein
MGARNPKPSSVTHPLSVTEDPGTAAIVLLTWAADDTPLSEMSGEQLGKELREFSDLRRRISLELARAGRRGDRAQLVRLRSLRDEVDGDIDEIEGELNSRAYPPASTAP